MSKKRKSPEAEGEAPAGTEPKDQKGEGILTKKNEVQTVLFDSLEKMFEPAEPVGPVLLQVQHEAGLFWTVYQAFCDFSRLKELAPEWVARQNAHNFESTQATLVALTMDRRNLEGVIPFNPNQELLRQVRKIWEDKETVPYLMIEATKVICLPAAARVVTPVPRAIYWVYFKELARGLEDDFLKQTFQKIK